MTIEIKEMLIKTVVTDDIGPGKGHDPELSNQIIEQLKNDILSDCKDMLSDMFEERESR